MAAVRVRYGEPLVVLTMLNPLALGPSAPNVAEVVTKPDGMVQVPLAVVQYWNLIEPMAVPVVGTVNWKKCFTIPPALEPPSVAPACSVKLRVFIWAADADPGGTT